MVIRDVDTSRERNGARGIACDTESGRPRRIGRRRFPSLGVSLTSGCLIGVETTGVTGTPWPCRRPNARMPIACGIQGDPPSLVRYYGEPGNYSQHATSYDRVRAFAALPASFPRSPRFSAPLSFVVPCRVAPRPFVSIRFDSFRFAVDANRVIAPLRIRGHRIVAAERSQATGRRVHRSCLFHEARKLRRWFRSTNERTKVFVVPISFQEAVGTIPSQVSQIIHHFEAERQEAR